MPSGEEIQRKGEEGAHRAKKMARTHIKSQSAMGLNPDRTAVKKVNLQMARRQQYLLL